NAVEALLSPVEVLVAVSTALRPPTFVGVNVSMASKLDWPGNNVEFAHVPGFAANSVEGCPSSVTAKLKVAVEQSPSFTITTVLSAAFTAFRTAGGGVGETAVAIGEEGNGTLFRDTNPTVSIESMLPSNRLTTYKFPLPSSASALAPVCQAP